MRSKDIDKIISYMIDSKYNINTIDHDNILFKNTHFLWAIFNCKPNLSLTLLNNKTKLNLDINIPSQTGYRLSPLMAAILKGRSRKCDNIDFKGSHDLSLVIDRLIDEKDIDLKYSTFNIDALKTAFAMFDYPTIKRIIDKDEKLFTLDHYYYYKFTFDLIIKLLKNREYSTIDSFIKNQNININYIVSPHLKLTRDFIFSNLGLIITYINNLKNINDFKNNYKLEIYKWNSLLNITCSNKKENFNITKLNITYPPFSLITKDLLYLTIQHNPLFCIYLLENLGKHLINIKLYYNISNNPIKLCELKYKQTNNEIYKIINIRLNKLLGLDL